MEVTCGVCSQTSELSEACDDKENWEAVGESQVVVDEVEGSVVRNVTVAHKLVWRCPCGEKNEIIEEV